MEDFEDKSLPAKAGVYAIREGPILAQNIQNFMKGKPLIEYIPQPGFIALMSIGDGNCIGSKFGITVYGKWVWKMKEFIDFSFT